MVEEIFVKNRNQYRFNMYYKSFLILLLLGAIACKRRELRYLPVTNGSVSIAYNLAGSGDTAIILVHGWAIDKEYWEKQVPLLAKRYNVITPDLGGHGQSGHNRNQWTIENYASDISAIIDQLDLRKAILVGHSMAGEICLMVALARPKQVIGLIGIDNFKGFVQRYTARQEAESRQFLDELKRNYDSLAGVFVRQGLFPADSKDSISINRVIHNAKTEDPNIAVSSLASLMQVSLQDSAMIGQLHFPLHLIACDPPPDMDQLKKVCKAGFGVRMIHGTGHYPMIEKPGEFNDLLLITVEDISRGK